MDERDGIWEVAAAGAWQGRIDVKTSPMICELVLFIR